MIYINFPKVRTPRHPTLKKEHSRLQFGPIDCVLYLTLALLIAALFILARTWKQPSLETPETTEEWVKKMCVAHLHSGVFSGKIPVTSGYLKANGSNWKKVTPSDVMQIS